MEMWTDMFHLGVPVWEKVLRAAIVYFFLVLALRLAGKRELAQLNPFDLVVLMCLSNTVQNAIIGPDNSLVGGLVGASTFILVNMVVLKFLYSRKQLTELVEGKAVSLIAKGVVDKAVMARELVTPEDLEAAALKQGFGSLDEVSSAVLEPGGTIAFKGKSPAPGMERFGEVLGSIERLCGEVAELRAALTQAPPSKGTGAPL